MLTELSDDLDRLEALVILSVSSNRIEALPECLANVERCATHSLHNPTNYSDLLWVCANGSLERVYANGNQIAAVPEGLCLLPNLKVSHEHPPACCITLQDCV